MANWCNNTLIVTGSDEAVRAFVDASKGMRHRYIDERSHPQRSEQFSFHALFPVPDNVLDHPFYPEGYEWEKAHWGCQWGCPQGSDVELHACKAIISFETPWTPPIRFLAKVAHDYPHLSFLLEYVEPSLGYKGRACWENGTQVFHEERQMSEQEIRQSNDEPLIDNDEE